jgi:transposase
MRATYHRYQGTEQFLGFYDVHADCFDGLFRERKRVKEVSEAFKRLRRCYPRRKLFVVLDNLRNVHDHPRLLALLRRLRIHPVWTPTGSSWLNLIEAQFGVLKRFTMTDTDDRTHVERRRRVYRYLRYRHRKVGTTDHLLTTIRQIKL